MDTPTFETLRDTIDEHLQGVAPYDALMVLTALIMTHTGRCEDPHRALLAVFAELNSLVRFAEAEAREDTKVLGEAEWQIDAWTEAE